MNSDSDMNLILSRLRRTLRENGFSEQDTERAFGPASEMQISWLRNRKLPTDVIEFYRLSMPNTTLDMKYRLHGFDALVAENEELEPGHLISQHGFFVVASDYDGDALAVDLGWDDTTRVLRVSHEVFSANPTSYFDQERMTLVSGPVSAELIRKRSQVISHSFLGFLKCLYVE